MLAAVCSSDAACSSVRAEIGVAGGDFADAGQNSVGTAAHVTDGIH